MDADEPTPALTELTEALYRHGDAQSLVEVLTTSLADLLPPDLLHVERRRSAADRMRGRPGRPEQLSFVDGDREYVLTVDERAAASAQEHHVVRGVRLSSRDLELREWVTRLAARLERMAAEDERTRAALSRFLLG